MTCDEIYTLALALLGVERAAAPDYTARVPALINTLLGQCLPADNRMRLGQEQPLREAIPRVHALGDTIDLNEALCLLVLPYGLAALLVLDEDAARAGFFHNTFLETLELFRRSGAMAILDIY